MRAKIDPLDCAAFRRGSCRRERMHVIDLSREIRLALEEDFIVALGFSYNPETKREPVVFAVSDERPAELVKTYRASGFPSQRCSLCRI